jgi:tetratricopeptide (TPR) repeat protein
MVREDTFAGYMVGDMQRFEKAMQYTDRALATNPENPDALVWKGGSKIFLAVRLYEKGENAPAGKLYDEGMALMDKAVHLAPTNGGVYATCGGVLVFFAPRLPDDRRRAALEKSRQMYEWLYAGQENALAQLPVHLSGEVLSALAETNQRLGNKEAARKYLDQIAQVLPNTPYARSAAMWVSQPEMAGTHPMVCQTCHDAGRLQPKIGN